MSGDKTSGPLSNTDNDKAKEWEKVLLQPFDYICAVPGKNVRGKLAMSFNDWMNVPADKLEAIIEVIQMLHNASLLVDDIEDNSILRRGVPVAHMIYGRAITINSANYVYFRALQQTLTLGDHRAVDLFCRQMLVLHEGQGMELHWRESFTCPTEEEYKQMIKKKTGGLFTLAVELMQLFSECTRDFSHLVTLLGLYFQIRDDYANLCLEEYADHKSFCEDLTEGKFSFPIIHAIHSRSDNQQVLHIIRQRPTKVEVKKYCVSLLDKFGSLEYTRNTLSVLDSQVRQEIDALGGNARLVALMDQLRGKW